MQRLTRVLWRAALAGAFIVLAVARAGAGVPGPRLRLPEDGVVSPGEVVTFYWDGADHAIREMEILVSTDGGAHYTDCVSPQLDPRAGEYTWRVPDLGTRHMRFRIRFNRGGREIEGEESACLHVVEPPHDPIAFPPSSEVAEAATAGTAGSETGDPSSSARGEPASSEKGRLLERSLGKASRMSLGHSSGAAVSAGRPSQGSDPGGGPPLLFIPPRK